MREAKGDVVGPEIGDLAGQKREPEFGERGQDGALGRDALCSDIRNVERRIAETE